MLLRKEFKKITYILFSLVVCEDVMDVVIKCEKLNKKRLATFWCLISAVKKR